MAKANMDEKLTSIEAARGVAAMGIVCLHCGLDMANQSYFGEVVFNGYYNIGGLGVPFFFVLSGFIIFYAHYKDLGNKNKIKKYLWRRFSRIYPTYWALIFFLTLLSVTGLMRPEMSVDYLKGLLLLPGGVDVFSVAWSLKHEVLFYFLFSFVIFHKIFGGLVLCLWFLGIILVHNGIVPQIFGNFFASFIFNFMNIKFFIGMATAIICLNMQGARSKEQKMALFI